MSISKIEELKEDFRLLIEAGFVAVKQLDESSATRIFNAAQIMSPDNVAPQIGLGYIALNKLEVNEAAKIFERVLEKEPDNHLAQTFLGMSFLLNKAKRKKGEKLIMDALEKTTNPTIKNLCEVSLEWAEKDLKKKEPPFLAAMQRSDSEDNE